VVFNGVRGEREATSAIHRGGRDFNAPAGAGEAK
jgi:hypothetical protein